MAAQGLSAWAPAAAMGQAAPMQMRQPSRQLGSAWQPGRRPRAAAAAAAAGGDRAEPSPSCQRPAPQQQLCGAAPLPGSRPWGARQRGAAVQRRRPRLQPPAADRHVSPEVPMMGDDQASTIYTALEGLESSFDEGDLQAQGSGAAALAPGQQGDGAAAPAAEQQQGGVPHRWQVVGMMALSFVLCNMDKVGGCAAVSCS